jgi:hypothetical protein
MAWPTGRVSPANIPDWRDYPFADPLPRFVDIAASARGIRSKSCSPGSSLASPTVISPMRPSQEEELRADSAPRAPFQDEVVNLRLGADVATLPTTDTRVMG